jgi:putative ABC transport system permease protein
MIAPLDRKLLRDMGKMKGQVVAVALVMACGLAMMIMARSLILSLESTRDAYYSEHRFADVFCNLKRAPNALRERLAQIDGVAAMETRVIGKVTLDLPGQAEPADGMIHSLPDDREQRLHLLYLRRGRLPERGSHGEVVVGEAFADVHGFGPGDEIDVTIYGARERLKIVGVVLSPEYVFEAREGEALPDNKRFGVFWMNERELAEAFDLDGAFNNVILDLAPGADSRPVMAALDRMLAPYGGLVAYNRRDHASAKQLDDELMILRGLSVAFPTVFLSIAAFMSSAVLSRLVRLQREQIAQLKAFGYSSREVGWHYLKFAIVIVTLATCVGGSVGLLLGTKVVELYHIFYRFPLLTLHPDWSMFGRRLPGQFRRGLCRRNWLGAPGGAAATRRGDAPRTACGIPCLTRRETWPAEICRDFHAHGAQEPRAQAVAGILYCVRARARDGNSHRAGYFPRGHQLPPHLSVGCRRAARCDRRVDRARLRNGIE